MGGGMGMMGGMGGMGGMGMEGGMGMGMGGMGKGFMGAKGAMGGAKGAGKGGKDGSKGGKSKHPRGSQLPRERLTAEKFSGEVIEWKGKYGYIMPAEPIEHPDAKKRPDGKVWVSISDCPNGAELAVGTPVAFHVYSDTSGTLGAEEVDA